MIENEQLTNENKGLDITLVVKFEEFMVKFIRKL